MWREEQVLSNGGKIVAGRTSYSTYFWREEYGAKQWWMVWRQQMQDQDLRQK
jgi:hypothetical protein